MGLIVDIRWDSRPSNRVETFFRGTEIVGVAHFRDAETLEYVDVSGVAARAWVPGGALLDPAPVVAEVATGRWSVTIGLLAAVYSGEWRIEASCSSPVAQLGIRDFILASPEPDETAPPGVTYYDAVSLLALAEAEAERAEAAADEAESAVSAGLGPVATSSVGGTDTAYTASSAQNVASGRSYWFTPNATNTGSATLSINGGTARSLRTEAGTQLIAGQLRSGVQYLIQFDGTLFRVLGLRLAQRFQSRVNLIGATATLDGAADGAEGTILARLGGMATGSPFLQVTDGAGGLTTALFAYGAGNSAGRPAREVRAFGPVRVEGDLTVVGSLNAASSSISANDVGEMMSTVAGPGDEVLIQTLTSTDTTPVQPTGADLNRRGWANVNGAWWDFDGLPKHADFEVGIGAAKVVNLYTGTATNWVGRTSNVVQVTGPAIIRAQTLQELGDMMLSSPTGATLTDVSTPTIPVYGRAWIIAGQSWFKRLSEGGRAGILATYRALGATTPATRIIDCAYGASGLFTGTVGDIGEDGEDEEDDTNFYWDHINDEPGPNATGMLATILAWVAANPTQPFPEAVLWQYGLPDLNILAATGDNTPAAWTAAQASMQAWLDAELSSALSTTVELNHFICPLPARKIGVWPESQWYALRRAQLDVIGTAPRTFRGPDTYDSVRMWNDGHHGFAMQKRSAARIPYFVENALRSATHYTGPRITDFHEVSSSEYWVRIERGYVSTGVTASLVRPALPAGFGLLPSGSLFQNRVAVSRYSWTTDANPGGDPLADDILRIFPTTPQSGLQLAYLYGSGYETEIPGNIVRDLRTFMPLQIW
jgi:hypothetical protein